PLLPPPPSLLTLFPYTTLFRSQVFSIKNKTLSSVYKYLKPKNHDSSSSVVSDIHYCDFSEIDSGREGVRRFVLKPSGDALYLYKDRKSTRLNSSHVSISYAVCC